MAGNLSVERSAGNPRATFVRGTETPSSEPLPTSQEIPQNTIDYSNGWRHPMRHYTGSVSGRLLLGVPGALSEPQEGLYRLSLEADENAMG